MGTAQIGTTSASAWLSVRTSAFPRARREGERKLDPFTKKEWYKMKAPAIFSNRDVGQTVVTRSSGTRIATECLKGRVVEANLADLNSDEDNHFRKFKLQIQECQGKNALLNFYGMDFCFDKVKSLVK